MHSHCIGRSITSKYTALKNTYSILYLYTNLKIINKPTLKLRNVPTLNEFELFGRDGNNGVLSLGSSLSVSEEYATACKSSLLP